MTDALIIAASTALLYFVAYSYERGYCDYFGIPPQLISPSTTNVIVAAVGVGTFLFLTLNFVSLTTPMLRAALDSKTPSHPYQPILLLNWALIALGIALIHAYGFSWWHFAGYLVGSAALNIVFFGIGMILHRKKGSIPAMLEAVQQDAEVDSFDIWLLIKEKLGQHTLLAVVVIIVVNGLSWIVGNGDAHKQTRFQTLAAYPEHVVLRVYGDRIIAGKANAETRGLDPQFIVFNISDSTAVRLETKTLGPLTPPPLKH